MPETELTGLTEDQAAEQFESMLAAESGDNKQDEKAGPEEVEEDAEPTESEEPEEAEDSDEEDSEEPESVEIDGVKIPLAQLKKERMLHADYTRKTQEIAEQRKAAQSDLDAAKAERAHYAQRLEELNSVLQAAAPQQPDWDRLLRENPTEYWRQQGLQFEHQKQVQKWEADRQQLAERQQAEQAQVERERIASEGELLVKAIPEWKDPKVAKADKLALVEFATARGYSPEELAQVNDHRVVKLLREAMLYSKIKAASANLKPSVSQGPRTATPGTPANRSGNELSRASQRLAKTGDPRDAALVMEHFL